MTSVDFQISTNFFTKYMLYNPNDFLANADFLTVEMARSGQVSRLEAGQPVHPANQPAMENESQPARVHLDASVTMNPRNVLGLYLQGNDSAAWSILQDVTPLQGHALDVARDITGSLCDSLRAGKEWAELDGVVASVLSLHDSAATARLMKAQPLRIAQAALAMYHRKDPHRAVALLTAEEGWAVSTRDLVPIWEDAQYAIAEATLARPLNLLDRARVRRAHPPPISIDFNGAT